MADQSAGLRVCQRVGQWELLMAAPMAAQMALLTAVPMADHSVDQRECQMVVPTENLTADHWAVLLAALRVPLTAD